jgi:hypothetical protein
MLALCAALLVLALAAGASNARASASCGIFSAAGHQWIIVTKGVSCTKAKQVVRSLAARTARLRNGQSVIVHTPLLSGFTCVLASKGKPGGSCSTAGAAKSILWLVAA